MATKLVRVAVSMGKVPEDRFPAIEAAIREIAESEGVPKDKVKIGIVNPQTVSWS